ncbi:hypothetical protein, partial [Legionella shakespearei]|uniref:hypothetical protein n=1 Tax=Legionella shakespearei TaxID=45075 RepID=UPI001ED9B5E8
YWQGLCFCPEPLEPSDKQRNIGVNARLCSQRCVEESATKLTELQPKHSYPQIQNSHSYHWNNQKTKENAHLRSVFRRGPIKFQELLVAFFDH